MPMTIFGLLGWGFDIRSLSLPIGAIRIPVFIFFRSMGVDALSQLYLDGIKTQKRF